MKYTLRFSLAAGLGVILLSFQNCGSFKTSQMTNTATSSRLESACSRGTSLSCPIANGTGFYMCGTELSSCAPLGCDAGFTISGQMCASTACSPASTVPCTSGNGTGVRTCSAQGAYGACTITGCNIGYQMTAGTCQKIQATTPTNPTTPATPALTVISMNQSYPGDYTTSGTIPTLNGSIPSGTTHCDYGTMNLYTAFGVDKWINRGNLNEFLQITHGPNYSNTANCPITAYENAQNGLDIEAKVDVAGTLKVTGFVYIGSKGILNVASGKIVLGSGAAKGMIWIENGGQLNLGGQSVSITGNGIVVSNQGTVQIGTATAPVDPVTATCQMYPGASFNAFLAPNVTGVYPGTDASPVCHYQLRKCNANGNGASGSYKYDSCTICYTNNQGKYCTKLSLDPNTGRVIANTFDVSAGLTGLIPLVHYDE